jgi:outer membrane receptor protein involved in Fe transport
MLPWFVFLLFPQEPQQQAPPVYTTITVTATMGRQAKAEEVAPATTVIGMEAMREHPLPTIGNALEGAPGVLVQQSTSAQVSPFLRGLTGYQVLNLIDGIRFNNSTFRSGPNQYLAFVEPGQSQRIETVLGPAGALYGSDAMGGAIQILTLEPRFATAAKPEYRAEWMSFFGTADLSAGTRLRISGGTPRLAWLAGGTVRRHNDIRAGDGSDSRHAFRRFFGLDDTLIRDLTGSRQRNTSFSQSGAHAKVAGRLTARQLLTGWYQFSQQEGVNGYKDLWGGQGRMLSQFAPQRLHFGYARWELIDGLGMDRVSATLSVNEQTDGGLRQGLRATDTRTAEQSRVRSLGYTAQGAKSWGTHRAIVFGGEYYDESVSSARTDNGRPVRPLYPDGSGYGTAGLFGQMSDAWFSGRLAATAGLRWTRASFSAPADPRFGVLASEQGFNDLTMNASLAWRIGAGLELFALGGRGFRAPNLNDLGAIGLNDLGYEIPASEAKGALMGASSAESALPLGRAVESLRPERLWNAEAGLRWRSRRIHLEWRGFDAELADPIVRRTLLYDLNAPPSELAGIPVRANDPTAAQRAAGVTTVSTAIDPRAVKAFVNDGQSRYYGLETLGRAEIARGLRVEAAYTYIAGRDLYPNRPIRRLPPQTGSGSLRWNPARRRLWIEARLDSAGAQSRLSGGDLDDERIGASRSRNDIASFFNGSRVAPWIDAAGRFTPTGETLAQIQNRVLPRSVAPADSLRVPLYRETAGWWSAAIRSGIPVGERWTVHLALENLADRNYRIHGSGIDAPGIGAWCGILFEF